MLLPTPLSCRVKPYVLARSHPVASVSLGLIEGRIRPTHGFVFISVLGPRCCHAHAESQLPNDGEGSLGYRPSDFLGAPQSPFGIGVQEDRQELLSAEAGDEITLPHSSFQHARELLKNVIAGVMAIGVVDLFEMIDIHEQDRIGAACSLQSQKFDVQTLVG